MNITQLELEVLAAIDFSDYGESITDSVWTFSVVDECKTVKGKQFSGVVSSLVKKGLVEVDDSIADESTIQMTSEGIRAYAENSEKVGKWIDHRYSDEITEELVQLYRSKEENPYIPQ